MAWKMDGRIGRAKVGGIERHGFALLRDPGRKLIAFHPAANRNLQLEMLANEVVIDEDAFEPAPESESRQS